VLMASANEQLSQKAGRSQIIWLTLSF
jgi:hypothetical protein